MSEKRIVPSNLMSWPRIKNLLPDQKLIIYHLWATAPSSAGCWLLDTAGFAAALSLREDALIDALAEFQRRGLVVFDSDTGEIFICDWYRWHTFSTAARRELLKVDLIRVQSQTLARLIQNSIERSRNIGFSNISTTCNPREKKASKDKRRAEKQEPRAAASSLSSFFEILRKNGARTPGVSTSADEANLKKLEQLASTIGEDSVLSVIQGCRYPTAAVVAATEAGLFETARKNIESDFVDFQHQIAGKTLVIVATGERWQIDGTGKYAMTSSGTLTLKDLEFESFKAGKIVIESDDDKLAA